jgi:ADP-L-glycero-D-manno-heptose 6-epimerase
MKEKIIVTGGAGFIGSALLWGLNKKGLRNILVVDHMDESPKWKNLINLKFQDYIDKDDFLEMILNDKLNYEKIDCIFHMGACSSTVEKDANFMFKNNFEYSKHLVEFAIKKGIRFIYASSAATYGDGSSGFSDDHELLEKLRPLNIYGYSKHLFDLWLKRNKLLDKVVGLKYFNVYGPNEYHKGEMRSFVVKAYEQIINTGEVKLFKSYKPEYKNGEQKRDFVYIKDAVDMTLFFFQERGLTGIYNIGTGEAHTWNELVNAVFKALDKEPKIRYIDMPEELKDQYQYFTQADISKIRKAGYKKELWNFDSAIEDYVINYLCKGYHLL